MFYQWNRAYPAQLDHAFTMTKILAAYGTFINGFRGDATRAPVIVFDGAEALIASQQRADNSYGSADDLYQLLRFLVKVKALFQRALMWSPSRAQAGVHVRV